MNKWLEITNSLQPRLDSNLLIYYNNYKRISFFYYGTDGITSLHHRFLNTGALFWKYMKNQTYSTHIILKEVATTDCPGTDFFNDIYKSEGIRI
jgi:hypothetical protein